MIKMEEIRSWQRRIFVKKKLGIDPIIHNLENQHANHSAMIRILSKFHKDKSNINKYQLFLYFVESDIKYVSLVDWMLVEIS